MTQKPARKERPARPYTADSLRELALFYVGRFATSRAKLTRYLQRKLAERGWEGEAMPDVAGLVEAMAGYGYVDDAAFAETQARSLTRRGYGRRRVDMAVRAAGIAEEDRIRADAVTDGTRVSSALKLAQRRRWGPFASERIDDPAKRERMIGAFLRAGHDPAISRAILALAPGADTAELEE